MDSVVFFVFFSSFVLFFWDSGITLCGTKVFFLFEGQSTFKIFEAPLNSFWKLKKLRSCWLEIFKSNVWTWGCYIWWRGHWWRNVVDNWRCNHEGTIIITFSFERKVFVCLLIVKNFYSFHIFGLYKGQLMSRLHFLAQLREFLSNFSATCTANVSCFPVLKTMDDSFYVYL